MSEFLKIHEVATTLNISTRSLRYWENAGLFTSVRDSSSGWRLYDEKALQSIRITEFLRRIDIPISDIKEILDTGTPEKTCQILQKQLNKLDSMKADLQIHKEIIAILIDTLRTMSPHDSIAANDLSALENTLLPASLKMPKSNTKKRKEGLPMKNSLVRSEVTIITLPPMRTAAYSCVGEEPEDDAYAPVMEWIKANNLQGTMHLFGFNTEPYPSPDNPAYGFGYCASIPEGIEISEPLYEWRLPGGIYAVISQYTGDPSHGWQKFPALFADPEWEWEPDHERPCLEAHISRGDCGGYYIPCMFPIKKRNNP